MNKSRIAKLSGVVYVIWGLLHLQAAYMVYRLATSLEPGMVHGRMVQHAWNLFFASVAAIGIAVTLNWRNTRNGYWINTGLVSLVDLGFIFFILIPGLVPMWPGLLGPVTWIIAWVLSTIAFLNSSQGELKPAVA
jgi:hypothetical protein